MWEEGRCQTSRNMALTESICHRTDSRCDRNPIVTDMRHHPNCHRQTDHSCGAKSNCHTRLLAFNHLVNQGVVVRVGLVRHDPAARHNFQLAVVNQSENNRNKNIQHVLSRLMRPAKHTCAPSLASLWTGLSTSATGTKFQPTQSARRDSNNSRR